MSFLVSGLNGLNILGQSSTGSDAGFIIFIVVYLALLVVLAIGAWKMFEKAGWPGWYVLIPFLNIYVVAKMGGKSGWWVLWCCLPWVGVIFGILLSIELAKAFGKGVGFILGLIFLPFVFVPILGFGDAVYGGPPGPRSPQAPQRGFAVQTGFPPPPPQR